jgi:hypothetical protein
MTTYASRQPVMPLSVTAQALYDEITAWSSETAERLALLSQREKTGVQPRDVDAVRHRLWAEYGPVPSRTSTGGGGRAALPPAAIHNWQSGGSHPRGRRHRQWQANPAPTSRLLLDFTPGALVAGSTWPRLFVAGRCGTGRARLAAARGRVSNGRESVVDLRLAKIARNVGWCRHESLTRCTVCRRSLARRDLIGAE